MLGIPVPSVDPVFLTVVRFHIVAEFHGREEEDAAMQDSDRVPRGR
jgi:hypothetical protein